MTAATVSLMLLGELRSIQAQELGSTISPYTGRPLRRLSFTLVAAGDDDHERLNAELKAARNDDVRINDSDGCRWKVLRNSFSYQSGQSPIRYIHEVELEMEEDLTLDRIEFEGVTLTPTRWSFHRDLDQPVALQVLADLEQEQHQRFERVLEERRAAAGTDGVYFPVLWVGISESPVSMRFGQCLWQPAQDDLTRYLIMLVSERGDNDAKPHFLEPGWSRIREEVAMAHTKLDALIEELRAADVLDEAAIERITGMAGIPAFTSLRGLERVNDVEKFFL